MHEEHVENEWGSPTLLFSSQLQRDRACTEKCCYVQPFSEMHVKVLVGLAFCRSLFPDPSEQIVVNTDRGWWQRVIFQADASRELKPP